MATVSGTAHTGFDPKAHDELVRIMREKLKLYQLFDPLVDPYTSSSSNTSAAASNAQAVGAGGTGASGGTDSSDGESKLISSVVTPGNIRAEGKIADAMMTVQQVKQPEPTPWQKDQEAGLKRSAALIGNVMLANAKYHKLETFNPTFGPDAISNYVNRMVKDHNDNAEEYSLAGVMNMGYALGRAGVGNVVSQKDTGEYKLNAFQIKNDSGKLVSELTDKGHYIEYNEDGTVSRDMLRLMTSSLPSILDNIHWDSGYGRYAAMNSDLYEDTEFF